MAKGHLHGAEHEDAARWSLSGIAGLFGDGSWPAQTPSTAPDARLRWLRTEHEVAMAGAPAWPEVELPEPTARTSVEQAAAVWLRHGWTLGQVIAAEQATAAELGTMPIWPQFDPAIVAGMGALSADALRAAF